MPEIQGGIGGENNKFYLTQSGCLSGSIACSTLSQYIASSNHFQVHFSGGVRLYVKGGLYLRPQVDVRWVNNFVEFGSDWVPEYTRRGRLHTRLALKLTRDKKTGARRRRAPGIPLASESNALR